MDYKALVAQGKYVGGRMDSGLERDVVFSLCDAVEALEKDRERLDRVAGYERMAQSSRITVICRSVPDVNLFAEMLSDAISRTASSPAPTASTPTPAAPSDA